MNFEHSEKSCLRCRHCVTDEAAADDCKYYCKRFYGIIPELIRRGKIWCHCFVKKVDEGVKDETD